MKTNRKHVVNKSGPDTEGLKTLGKWTIGAVAIGGAVFSGAYAYSHFGEALSLLFKAPSNLLSSAVLHDNLKNTFLYSSAAIISSGLSFASFQGITYDRHIVTNVKKELDETPATTKLAFLGVFVGLVALQLRKPLGFLAFGDHFSSMLSKGKNAISSFSGLIFSQNVVEYYKNTLGFVQTLPLAMTSIFTMHLLSKNHNPAISSLRRNDSIESFDPNNTPILNNNQNTSLQQE